MIIKEAKYKTVTVKQRRQVSPDVYGCDHCRAEIKEYPNEESRLEVKIFSNDDATEYKHFCSWSCVLAFLPTIECKYFVDLPFLYYDVRKGGERGADELLRLLDDKRTEPRTEHRKKS
jgi:hypothetical protein